MYASAEGAQLQTYSARCVMQGLWTAWYGAHGPEIVHVWFEESLLKHSVVTAQEEPDHLPRPRLVGCKVTGDPNVPANQWTFEAQVWPFMLFSTRHAALHRNFSQGRVTDLSQASYLAVRLTVHGS